MHELYFTIGIQSFHKSLIQNRSWKWSEICQLRFYIAFVVWEIRFKHKKYCIRLDFPSHVDVELMDLISSILKGKSNGKPIIIKWGITYKKKENLLCMDLLMTPFGVKYVDCTKEHRDNILLVQHMEVKITHFCIFLSRSRKNCSYIILFILTNNELLIYILSILNDIGW